jgi:hypothetical protein
VAARAAREKTMVEEVVVSCRGRGGVDVVGLALSTGCQRLSLLLCYYDSGRGDGNTLINVMSTCM